MSAIQRRRDCRDPALVLQERQEILAPVLEGQRVRQRREQLETERRQRMLHVKLSSVPKRLESKPLVNPLPKEEIDMSKKTMIEELDKHFVALMRNWVMSRSGNGFAMSKAYEGAQPSSGYAESKIPTLVGDAADVDDAMKEIGLRYREAVRLFWEREGASLRWLGDRLKCDKNTAKARVERGHNDLRAILEQLRYRSDRFRQEAKFVGAMA